MEAKELKNKKFLVGTSGSSEILEKLYSYGGSLVFSKYVKDKNFITPYVLGYIKINNESVIEISKGEGIERKPVYGVTVLRDGSIDYEYSKCLHSIEELDNYVIRLLKRIGYWSKSQNFLIEEEISDE